MPLHIPSNNKIITLAGICVAAVFFAGLFLYQVHAQPLTARSDIAQAVSTAPGKAYLSPPALDTAPSASTGNAPMHEVHIANNGLVLLRGARIVAIDGDTIDVTVAFGVADFTWTLQTTSGTKFIKTNGDQETLGDVHVGDIVVATGLLSAGGTDPTIDTQFVREYPL